MNVRPSICKMSNLEEKRSRRPNVEVTFFIKHEQEVPVIEVIQVKNSYR